MRIKGQIVDITAGTIYPAELIIADGKIKSIDPLESAPEQYIMPGFIDAHIHIESSMLVPSEFARIAVKHGTVATVSDPHEIANVLGVQGVEFMINNGKQVPLKFNFGAPSCVPATTFETAGAVIDAEGIRELLQKPEIKYLAEMMNYPAVIYQDSEVLKKIKYAKQLNKPVDGHAPGLRGSDLSKYIQAGITTDHETVTFEEGFEKLSKGMKVIIREGSAAKNFDALVDLIPDHYSSMMFCSDDKHPDDLLLGHINQLCARAMERGHDLFHVLQMACINPVTHYDLDVGQLQPGDKADLIVVKDLKSFAVSKTIIDGKIVYEEGQLKFDGVDFEILNNFDSKLKKVEDFECIQETDEIRVIEAIDGELITREFKTRPKYEAANIISDLEKDVLKLAVVNRYGNKKPAIGFIKNFGLTKGAIASSVGHDSHNIIAVGVTDDDLCWAVNSLIAHKGGICAVTEDEVKILPLPVAGIMSDQDAQTVGQQYAEIDQMAKAMGSELQAPFMTLSFMALLVIPSLKLSDQGLFDGNTFRFTPLAVD